MKFNQLSTSVDRIKKSAEEKKGKGKNDPRYLNYFNLKEEDDSIVVRFLPVNDQGDVFFKYHIHQHANKNIPNIACAYESSGVDCPACQIGWEAHESGDKKTAAIYRKQDKILAQVVVVHSDIDINKAEDGNLVKLMFVPFAIYEEVIKSINNGLITGDAHETNFVIKRAIGKNKQPHYKNSFFKPNSEYEIPQEFIDSFDDGESYLYDLTKEAPEPTTTKDIKEWIDKVEALDEDEDEDGSSQTGKSQKTSLDEVFGKKKSESKPIDNSDDDDDDEKEVPAKSTSSSDLLDMLNNRKRD